MSQHLGRCPECGRQHRKDARGVEIRAALLAEGKKHCFKCGEVKDLTAFSKNVTTKDGAQNYCKPCQVRVATAYQKKRPAWNAEHLAAQRRYRAGQRVDRTAKKPYRAPAPPAGRCLTIRRSHLRRKYGIELEEYAALLDAQAGVCAICREAAPDNPQRFDKQGLLAVDHDEETGKVRGLLCLRCNMALGLLKHSPGLMEHAAAYIRRHVT